MKKHEISKIGAFHLNHNEDSSAIVEISENKLLIAVMDGCSMGKESHFASTLIAKLLRKIGKEIYFRGFAERTQKDTNEYLVEILERLFEALKQLKNQLHLEREEMLSTLVLGVFDSQRQEVELLTVGDGLVCCNGELFEYEQDDKPDYLGYHLGEEFISWLQNQSQRLSIKNVQDISLSTDGIFTFKNFDGKEYEKTTELDIIRFLLVDEQWASEDSMLNKKIMEIETKFGLKPSDDLTIIRILNKSN